MFIVVFLGMILSYWSNGTSTEIISNNGTFEDQYVEFSYPTSIFAVKYTFENYTVVDFYNSSDTNFESYIGNIRFSNTNLTNIENRIYTEGYSGEFSGYSTWEGDNTKGPYVYIILSSGTTNVKVLEVNFNSEYKYAFDQILNSLVIKKIPALTT